MTEITENTTLWNGDCLEEMKHIPSKSIDMILCDLPYGVTVCKWDVAIPLDQLWKEYNRIIKDNGCIALFGTEPFSSRLRLSNIKNYKYDLYWVKQKPVNFLQLKRRFGKTTENICIFYKQQCTYNPQKTKAKGLVEAKPKDKNNSSITAALGNFKIKPYKDDGTRYPTDILHFNRVKFSEQIHETQKPIELLKYLVKTFTNEDDLVLDNCMGSGSTGVACKQLNRRFIGIELDEHYFNIAKERIEHETVHL